MLGTFTFFIYWIQGWGALGQSTRLTDDTCAFYSKLFFFFFKPKREERKSVSWLLWSAPQPRGQAEEGG